MTKVDFSKAVIKDIDGNVMENVSVQKNFGNMIFTSAEDVVEHELGIKIYHAKGEIELTEEEMKKAKKYVERITSYQFRKAIQDAIG